MTEASVPVGGGHWTEWQEAAGDALTLRPGDRPVLFTFAWRDRPFQCRLIARDGQVEMALWGVVGQLPYSAESRTVRAHWHALVADDAAKSPESRVLARTRRGEIMARLVTLIPPDGHVADVTEALFLCLVQLAPVLDRIDALRGSRRLNRILGASALNPEGLNAPAAPEPDPDRSDSGP